jgi:exodeoxyribonuclease VII large subunit
MKTTAYSVTQVNRYLRKLIEDDVILNGFFLDAEISGFKPHPSGHCYFTAKDEASAINCVMFKTYAGGLAFMPENGMRVVMYGRLSMYEKTGQTQFYAEMMEPFGKGALYTAFEQLKQKLEKEGLFSRKRPVPKDPSCIAVVTAPTGAAVRDIISVCGRRAPQVTIVIIPALVQGDGAAASVASAIRAANDWGRADVLIVGRGGGSAEDLWAFNEEAVARAIFASSIPVISAVGHETDFTIADFCADLRAPTPSAAAELAAPDIRDKWEGLRAVYDDLNDALDEISAERNKELGIIRYMDNAVNNHITNARKKFEKTADGLHLVSPVNVLKRGYGLVYGRDGAPLSSVKQTSAGDEIKIMLKDGEITAKVSTVRSG